jgi:hypothetical protein
MASSCRRSVLNVLVASSISSSRVKRINKPRAGLWRISTQTGAAGIEQIDSAGQLPDPKVRARVTRKGSKVTVAWRSNKIPGQQIELVERAASGTATIIQKRTTKTRGRVTFTPANALVKRRRIEAAVLQNGIPRPPVTVARYKLAVPKGPGRATKLKAKRTGTGLAITWVRAARAREYVVTITAGTTVLTRTITRKPALTYTGAPAGKLTIRVVPRDRFARTGRSTKMSTG